MKNQSYSSQELQEFKTLIESKLKAATETYNLLQEQISNKNNTASDTCWKFGSIEDGGEALSKEEQNIMAHKQAKFIEGLKHALTRIGNKTYGVCHVTGELIPKQRLMAVPHTTTLISVKQR